jgi:hypothetical protein
MKRLAEQAGISIVAVALLSASTAIGISAESEKPNRGATIPIGLNGIPRQAQTTDQAIAKEFQLNFYTTIIQWREPEPT